jgi:D-alanyl-D-alanine carboxypeptidase
MFTAGVILKYQEEGKLNLDDSVGMWLPPYEHIDGSITLRQLLNHTSGIYDIVENQELWNDIYADPGRTWDLEEVVQNYVKAPYFEKGNNWHYSNTGYILLRMMIKAISGKSVGDVYREYLIDPVGLKSTCCIPDEPLPERVAHGWLDVTGDNVYDDLPAENMKSFYSMAGGGIFCTAEDLALWIRKLLHEKTVISAASMQEMKEYVFPTPGEDLVERYGLGLLVFNKELTQGMQVTGHGGNPLGYAAGAFYLEEHGVCIGLMDNTEHGVSMPVIEEIMEIIKDHAWD